MTREEERDQARTSAESHLVAYTKAQDRFAQLVVREMELNAQLPLLEQRLITSLVGSPKPGEETAEKPKLHSVSSAEEAIKTHTQLLDHKRITRDVVLEKEVQLGRLTAARLSVQLAIALLAALGPIPEVVHD